MSFPGRLAPALLIQGGNGSGKTTLLDSIASLWQFWGEWIDVGDGKAPPKYQLKHYLASARFVAMEVHEIAPTMRPLWICIHRTIRLKPVTEGLPGPCLRRPGAWRASLEPDPY